MNNPFRLLLCLFFALLTTPAFAFAPGDEFTGRVTRIADGDTISVLASDSQGRRDTQMRVRLYGIDAPKRGQPFSNQATQATSRAMKGNMVTVQVMDIDREGRIVGVVTAQRQSESLNGMLVRTGMAWVYPEYCKDEDICGPLRELEKIARAERRGLWSGSDPVPPWEWRGQR